MTVYARYDGPKVRDHLTPGKHYALLHENDIGFRTVDDAADRIDSLWGGSMWTRVELPDERGAKTMTESEAIVFTEVYNYERDHGSAPSQAAQTAGYAVSVFRREVVK